MKSLKSFVVMVALVAVGTAFAAENKPAGCCAKATKEGRSCNHSCCVEAAKAGNNCAKCGGSGKIQPKPEPKK